MHLLMLVSPPLHFHTFVNKVESRDTWTSILTYFLHLAFRFGHESKANDVTKSQALKKKSKCMMFIF